MFLVAAGPVAELVPVRRNAPANRRIGLAATGVERVQPKIAAGLQRESSDRDGGME